MNEIIVVRERCLWYLPEQTRINVFNNSIPMQRHFHVLNVLEPDGWYHLFYVGGVVPDLDSPPLDNPRGDAYADDVESAAKMFLELMNHIKREWDGENVHQMSPCVCHFEVSQIASVYNL